MQLQHTAHVTWPVKLWEDKWDLCVAGRASAESFCCQSYRKCCNDILNPHTGIFNGAKRKNNNKTKTNNIQKGKICWTQFSGFLKNQTEGNVVSTWLVNYLSDRDLPQMRMVYSCGTCSPTPRVTPWESLQSLWVLCVEKISDFFRLCSINFVCARIFRQSTTYQKLFHLFCLQALVRLTKHNVQVFQSVIEKVGLTRMLSTMALPITRTQQAVVTAFALLVTSDARLSRLLDNKVKLPITFHRPVFMASDWKMSPPCGHRFHCRCRPRQTLCWSKDVLELFVPCSLLLLKSFVDLMFQTRLVILRSSFLLLEHGVVSCSKPQQFKAGTCVIENKNSSQQWPLVPGFCFGDYEAFGKYISSRERQSLSGHSGNSQAQPRHVVALLPLEVGSCCFVFQIVRRSQDFCLPVGKKIQWSNNDHVFFKLKTNPTPHVFFNPHLNKQRLSCENERKIFSILYIFPFADKVGDVHRARHSQTESEQNVRHTAHGLSESLSGTACVNPSEHRSRHLQWVKSPKQELLPFDPAWRSFLPGCIQNEVKLKRCEFKIGSKLRTCWQQLVFFVSSCRRYPFCSGCCFGQKTSVHYPGETAEDDVASDACSAASYILSCKLVTLGNLLWETGFCFQRNYNTVVV